MKRNDLPQFHCVHYKKYCEDRRNESPIVILSYAIARSMYVQICLISVPIKTILYKALNSVNQA